MRVKVDGYAWLPKEELGKQKVAELRKSLTFTPRRTHIKQDDPQPIALYRETQTHFGMPRSYFLERRRLDYQIELDVSMGHEVNLDFNGVLRPDQAAAVDAIERSRMTGGLGGIIQAPPGVGKTVLSLYAFTAIRRSALVIVNRGFLQDQWVKRIKGTKKIAGFVPDARVGIIKGDICQYGEDFDISIAMVQTLAAQKEKLPLDFWHSFGLIITDECVDGNAFVTTDCGRKFLRDIAVGDHVLSFGNGSWSYKKVIRKWDKGIRDTLKIRTGSGREIRVTPNHLLMTRTGWLRADSVDIGTEIVSPISRQTQQDGFTMTVENTGHRSWDTSFDRVVSIDDEYYDAQTNVFDIEVEDHHNFVANGLLVHNCHRIGAPKWNDIVPKFSASYRIGVSATPRRKDGMEPVFFSHIGRVLHESKVKRVTPKLRRIYTSLQIPQTHKFIPNRAGDEVLKRWLVKSPERNQLIVNELVMACRAGRKIIVLSERRKHLEILKAMFDAVKPEGIETSFYLGGMKRSDLDAAESADTIFSSYQMTSEAFDVPELDTAFLVSPISDVEQSVGRIMREYGDKRPAVVTDFIDDAIPRFSSMWNKRREFYIKEGMYTPGG